MSIDVKDNESLTTVQISLTQNQAQRLQKMADYLGITVEQLIEMSINDMLKPNPSFDKTTQELLEENDELLRRLA